MYVHKAYLSTSVPLEAQGELSKFSENLDNIGVSSSGKLINNMDICVYTMDTNTLPY